MRASYAWVLVALTTPVPFRSGRLRTRVTRGISFCFVCCVPSTSRQQNGRLSWRWGALINAMIITHKGVRVGRARHDIVFWLPSHFYTINDDPNEFCFIPWPQPQRKSLPQLLICNAQNKYDEFHGSSHGLTAAVCPMHCSDRVDAFIPFSEQTNELRSLIIFHVSLPSDVDIGDKAMNRWPHTPYQIGNVWNVQCMKIVLQGENWV